MPPRIVPILDRLRQDQSELLTRQAIEEACRQEGYTRRKRLLDPVVTVYLFLLQVLPARIPARSHSTAWMPRAFASWSASSSRKIR